MSEKRPGEEQEQRERERAEQRERVRQLFASVLSQLGSSDRLAVVRDLMARPTPRPLTHEPEPDLGDRLVTLINLLKEMEGVVERLRVSEVPDSDAVIEAYKHLSERFADVKELISIWDAPEVVYEMFRSLKTEVIACRSSAEKLSAEPQRATLIVLLKRFSATVEAILDAELQSPELQSMPTVMEGVHMVTPPEFVQLKEGLLLRKSTPLELPTELEELLNDLARTAGSEPEDVLRKAVVLMGAAMKAKQQGLRLGVVDNTGTLVTEIVGF